MYRSILLPLDGSLFGEHAIQLATVLARRTGARLHLVHVHNPNAEVVTWEPVTPFRFMGLDRSEREWDGNEMLLEEQYLTTQTQVCAGQLAGCADCKIISGPVVAALEQEIRDTNPDLIVMATHGRSGFSRMWLGSVADALVRSARKPLLLVRTESEEAPVLPTKLANVLIPLDGSLLAESIVPHALDLGEGASTTFTLLRVVPPVWTSPEIMSEPDTISEGALRERITESRQYLTSVADRMKGDGLNVKCEVVVGTAAAATILEYTRRREVDVIAMATHGRGGVQRLILGSVADKVLRGAEVPMLVYRPA